MHSSVSAERYVRWFVSPTKSYNRSLFKHTMKWGTNALSLLPCPLYVWAHSGFSHTFFSVIFGIFLQLKLSYAVAMFLTLPWPEDSLNLSQGNRDDFVNWISQSFLWKSVNQLSSKRGCDTYRELRAFTFLGLIISLWLAVITAVPPDWWIGISVSKKTNFKVIWPTKQLNHNCEQ